MIKDFISSFNPSSYRKLVFYSLKRSLFFLFIFVIFISGLMAFFSNVRIGKILPKFESSLKKNFHYLIYDLPPIEIKEGKLIYPKKVYLKKWNNRFIFLISPDNDSSSLGKYRNVLLITQKNIFLKWEERDEIRIKKFPLREIKYLKIEAKNDSLYFKSMQKEFVVTSSSIGEFFKKLSFFLYPFLFLLFFSWYAFTKPAYIFLFSIFSVIFSQKLGVRLFYKNIFNLGIYANVLPTSLALLKEALGMNIPFFWAIYSFIYLLFLRQVIKMFKEAKWSG
ncbi:MAG: hypothetical protein B6D55_01670 [Candidatus Omnitrophica bacterium 4484_70.2]|nr:MAG: hypothetical protein B6D55_01670 [Candidatus Omnitrophica bacterium 4484_70.2]